MSGVVVNSENSTVSYQGMEVPAASGVLWKYLLMMVSFLMATVSIMNIVSEPNATSEWPYIVTTIFIIWLSIYLIATYRYMGTIYLFLSAYILCLAIFHFGHLFAHVSGLYDLEYLVKGKMAFWHQQAAWYCSLAFAMIGIGASISLKSYRQNSSRLGVVDDGSIHNPNLEYAFWIGFALLLAGFVGLLLTIGSIGNLLKFSRADIFGGVGDTRGYGFFLVVAPSALVLLVAAARSSGQKMFAYSSSLIIVLLILFLGYRSSVMFPGLIGAILWVKLGRRIPFPVVIVAILVVLIAIPSVRYLRAQGAYEDVSQAELAASLQEAKNTEGILIELGGVSSVVAYVIKTVPEDWPFRYGQSYLLALETAVPNIGLSMEKSGRGAFLSRGIVDREALSRMHPADWYTYIVDRWLYDRGGGAGFSTIAEAYLNFGIFGVIIYFYGLGYLLGRLDQVNLKQSPKLLVFSGSMLWPLLKTVRNSFGVFLKPVVFVLVSIFIWRIVSLMIGKRT